MKSDATLAGLTLAQRSELLKKARARDLARRGSELPPIEPAPRDERVPLSFAQQRLWFVEQLGGLGNTYHVGRRLRLRGELDRDALVRALDRVVARHEGLRTTFAQVDGVPEQRIAPADARFHLVEHDLAGRADAEAELDRLVTEEGRTLFDLEQGPLIRGRLIRVAADDHVLALTMHHIVSDAWSMGVLTRELGTLYAAFRRGEPDPLPPLPVQYADYAVWQRRWVEGEVLREQAAYWTRTLAGAPELLELPTDHPRPARMDHAGARVSLELDEALTAGLTALSRRNGTTLFMTLLAGWAAVLGRLSGQDDVVIGSPMAGRGRPEIEGLIGFFVNTLALRVDLSGAPTVAELLGRVKERVIQAQQNQDIPFEQVVDLVDPARSLARPPLFQALFAWQATPRASGLSLPGLEAAGVGGGAAAAFADVHANRDLSLSLREADGRITGTVLYATALFRAETVQRFAGYLRRALEEMVADEARPVDRLALMSADERVRVLQEWNRTEAEFPRESTIHDLFEAQAARTPDAVAVVYEGDRLTYAALNARANQLAHHLRALGVGPDVRVAICVERGLETMVGLLAILKAGGAYVPLDPAYPAERLAYMLADSAPAAVLTQQALRDRVDGAGVPVLELDAAAPAWASEAETNPVRDTLTPEHAAYVIYTSGSTGTPKGVVVPHRAVASQLAWAQRTWTLRADEAVLQRISLSFDVSVRELFWALTVGARVVFAGPAGANDPAALVEIIAREGIGVIHSVPTLLQAFLEHPDVGSCTTLARVMCGGEVLSPALARRFHERLPHAALYHMYGPTETTVAVTAAQARPEERHGRLPLGRPVANTRAYVLDGRGEPVPVGAAGELCIGGAQLARGYLGRAEMTAERFVADPFAGTPGARMYRTGDLARWLPDGTLEFLGRTDHQVKLRGFRIELGEIEARLREHPAVREAMVLVREDAPGDARLVAYVAGEEVGAEVLRAHVGETLPEYMVPAAYVRLDAFPLTPNGKVDRKALPAPEEDAFAARRYEAPLGDTEEVLAGIWAEVLRVERVGRRDNFFELGGHSLLAVQVISRVRQALQVEVALGEMFTRPVLEDFARELKTAVQSDLPPVEPVSRDERIPLSFPQQRLWFLEQLGDLGSTYHIRSVLRLRGDLDRVALVRALDAIVARHEALRTVFAEVNGVPEQRIAPSDSGFHLAEHDLAGRADADAELGRLMADEAGARFDLERGPLIRGRLIRVAADDHVLVLTMHHIVSDGWSMGVLTRELAALYGAFRRGEPDPLAALPVQYADYAAWQRRWVEGDVLQAQADYWADTLSGAPELLELPTDHPRPAKLDHAGATVGLVLDAELSAGLRALSRRHGATPFMTLLAGWAVVLSRLSGEDDLVIGTPTAGRGRREIEGLIGFFVNTLALRVDLSGAPTVAELLARVKARALEAQHHQDIPFEQVVERLDPARSLSHTPLVQVMFAWQEASRGTEVSFPGLELGRVGAGSARVEAKFDVSLSLGEAGDRIVGSVRYATALFEPRTVERWVGYLRRVLQEMVADDGQPVERLALLSASERVQVLEGWNRTDADPAADVCVHDLFAAQAARTPDAPAVVFEDEQLTYAELDRRANRLAHHLVRRGVGPDVRVGVCVEPGVEMMTAVLAVLKAGGGYVPLDPAYPADRLAYMLADSAPAVLLTQASLAGLFAESDVPRFSVDADASSWAHEPETDPARGVRAEHLAYVIYTSGSTGRPKGVRVEHGALAPTMAAAGRAFGFGPADRAPSLASFAFDIWLFEALLPLLAGGSVRLFPRDRVLEVPRLVQDLAACTVLHAVPALMRRIVHEVRATPEGVLPGLRSAFVGGDAVAPDLLEEMRIAFPAAEINVLYGPTEAAIICATHRLGGEPASRQMVGRPLGNAALYVLLPSGDVAPVGAPGELCLGGRSVARDYLGRPGLTAERFVPDPFSAAPGARLYRTGDRVRWLSTGELEFLGRTDRQVKVRGFRIEPGEIEARLVEHPAVREAVVLVREDTPGDKRLVAYVAGDETIGADVLRAHLGERLPAYMVPAAYVRMDALPLTPNGKLDRKALPAPEGDAFARRGYEAPVGETEQALAEIWADVLRIDRVSRRDSFFEVGGHSLLAVQVISSVRQALQVQAALGELFARPVLADFARVLETAVRAELPPIEPVSRNERIPLSFAQQRLWFLEQLGGLGGTYHMPMRLRLRGELNRDALVRALDDVVARHEALRTVFAQVDGVPEQRIAPADAGFLLVEHDLGGRADADAELGRLVAREAAAPFDLRRGPLIRGRLIRLAADDHVLLVTMHHIVSDGWSMGVLTEEFSALYAAHAQGTEARLPALPIQYADYAAWQRRWVEGEVLQAQADYWTRTLASAPELLELPADHPRPAQMDHAGARLRVELDEALTAGLKALGQRHGTTLFMTVLAGWATVLGRLSGQGDVVIGTPTANRGRREIEGLIGFFVNTLALRVDLSGAPTVAQLLERVKERALGAQHHQDIPFEQVVELVDPVRSLSHGPLFQVMFAWQNAPRGGLGLPGLALGRVDARDEQGTAKEDLSLSLGEANGRIVGGVTYATSLFERDTIQRWLGYLRRVLEEMVADDARPVERLALMPPSERARVVEEWNRTDAAVPPESCVHQLFQAQVERMPHAAAVVCGTARLSYGELNARANRLAHHLRALGVRPEARVALVMPRSAALVQAELAVVKCGGVYVPLDPEHPGERLREVLADSAPAALLTTVALAERFASLSIPVLAVDAKSPAWSSLPATNPVVDGLTPEHLAYVMYTSGSTGRPKGVMVPHRSIVRLVVDNGYADFGPDDRVAFAANPAFDATTMEVWAPLVNGGTIVVIDQDTLLEPRAMARVLEDEGVTALFITTAVFNRYAETIPGALAGLRFLLTGGESADPASFARVLGEGGSGTVIHCYGPTETTTFAITHDVRHVEEGARSIPLGRPIGNTRAYLLDRAGEPVPVGVAGELYVGGVGVARGYQGRAELTAERFVPDPWGEPGARLYRTGDLMRWRPEGTLEFLGRTDHQVKVRGFRIEPGEIEARLLEHPGVREAIVLVREDTPGDKRLVAYVAAEEAAGADVLRAHLGERLPAYMVPAAFVRLDALPLNSNGKVDRRALPLPEGDDYARRGYEAPVGETETALAGLWAQVLGLERVGRNDGFFELGGHSLLAVTLIERMRRQGLHADVRTLFAAPTLASLAAAVGGPSAEVRVPPNRIPEGSPVITPEMLPLVTLDQAQIDAVVAAVPGGAANVQDIYPLAPLQEGFLFHHLAAAEGDPYLLASLTRFDTRERLDAHLRAFGAVMARHDVLRTAVMWEGLPEPVQVVWHAAPLPVEEVEVDPAVDDVAAELYRRFDPRRHRLDIRQAPLMRGYVARDAARQRWVLLMLQHHLTVDHTALDALRDEIDAHLEGRADALPEPPPFRNFVAQARLGVSADEHRAFFQDMLGDVDEPTAPFGLLDVRGDGSGIGEARVRVDAELAARLRERARTLGVSAATLCHVAWAQVLARVSGRDDVVFGTVLFGRMQGGQGADRVVGPFINTLPIRIRLGNVGVEASVRRTHALLAGLLRHEHASLSLAQRCSGVDAPAPLFTALLNYRHGGRKTRPNAPSAARPAAGGAGKSYTQERSSYPLTMAVDDLGEALVLTAKVQARVQPGQVCALMHTALAGLVDALETAPERPVGSIAVLPPAERARVLDEWNRTDAEYPADACVHELFQAQAARTPDAPAVVFEGGRLTYAELNRLANRLAHHLRTRGVGPDVPVGLCLERGPEMIVAVLAVLKAGGAYVPLDPEYPEDRLRYMLDDSAPAVLLTQAALAERFAGSAVPCVRIDTDAAAWADEAETDPARGALTPDHLVYVIYTSGSTGKPKGVMNQHRALVNRVAWGRRSWSIDAGEAVLCKTSLNFDGHVREIFLPLIAGGRVVVARPGGHRDPDYLLEVIGRENITTVNLVPSLLQVLLDAPEVENLRGLRRILSGGEALPGSLVERCLAALPGVELHNLYGPSEAATAVTAPRLSAGGGGAAVPIGGPSANARVYVLDGAGEPVPVGVAGELFIGGVPVARGYLGRPALTAERFVPDPFGGGPGARLYRTGDVVRWLADGQLDFMGRDDDQVKVRGFRVELGEIEARLREHPGVREAAVVAREDVPGDRRLVAYYLAGEGIEAEALRAHLGERLPEYMVPAAYVRLDALPLTPSFKLDRRALPAPEGGAYASSRYEAPVGEAEQALAGIWADLLRVERVGRRDNFFDLGGHSLLAVQVVSRIRQALQVQVPLGDVFSHPTVQALAARLSGADGESASDRPIAIRATGSQPPLFLVYEGGGSTEYAQVLHPHVDGDIPVYALPAPAPDAGLRTMEGMATRLVRMIREVQPAGPYRVAGWSFGGNLAYEIAAQLIGQDETVEFVGMFDSYCPTHSSVASREPMRESDMVLQVLQMLRVDGAGSEGGRVAPDEVNPAGEVDLEAFVARLRGEGRLSVHVTVAQFRRMLDHRLLHRHALRGYAPQPLPVAVHLFPAGDSREPDPSRGWRAVLSERSLRVTPVPGTHTSMMRVPNAATLGQALSRGIQNRETS